MAANYDELCDDRSPGSVGFSMEGGKGTLDFLVDRDNLDDSIQDLLGSCKASGTGRLERILPRAHPQFPWLFAESINIHGLKPEADVGAGTTWEASPVSAYVAYNKYVVKTTFTSRPYALISDDSITEGALEWTDRLGVDQTNAYATEWWRFTEWFYEPGLDLVTGTQGMLKFRGDTGVLPNGVTAAAMPFIRIPKVALVVRWHYVPFRYVYSENSYIMAFQGLINQIDWAGFPAGSLLYNTAKVTLYTPPFPERFETSEGFTAFSDEKLCTVDLMMEYTNRTMANVTPTAPASVNYIQAGHNLAPWFGNRQFYYVSTTDNTTDADNTKRYPTYFSAPFQLLFSDPDVSL